MSISTTNHATDKKIVIFTSIIEDLKQKYKSLIEEFRSKIPPDGDEDFELRLCYSREEYLSYEAIRLVYESFKLSCPELEIEIPAADKLSIPEKRFE